MGALSREEARRRIHDAGMRATAPRVAVFRLLSDSDRPLSHSEVVDALGSDAWDKATLYRNLLRLAEGKLARVASRVGGITRYEARAAGEEEPHLHPHFACRDCGTVQCLRDAKLSMPVSPKWRDALLDADLQIVGRCPSCRRPARRRARDG